MTGPGSLERLESLAGAFRVGERGGGAELADGLGELLAPLVSRYGLDALTEAYFILCRERARAEPVRDLGRWLCGAVKARLRAEAVRERRWLAGWESPAGGPEELEDLMAGESLAGFPAVGVSFLDVWFEELEEVLVEEAFWPAAVARECVDALVLCLDGPGRNCFSVGSFADGLVVLRPGVRCEVARALLAGDGYLGLRARGLGASQARAGWLSHGGDLRLLWDGLCTAAAA